MKGTVVAIITGLAVLMAVEAAGDALLVEQTLAEEATRALAVEGIDAHVTFPGLTATVSTANPEQLPTALRLVLDVPGVVRAEADRSSMPTISTSQPTTSTLAPTSTLSPKPSPSESAVSPSLFPSPSPSPASSEMPKSMVRFKGGGPGFPSSEHTKVIELAVWLQANPDVTVKVDGHANNGRSPASREELSEERARHMVDVLVAAGTNRGQPVTVGKADTESAESNSTPEGQAKNRRVTFMQRGER